MIIYDSIFNFVTSTLIVVMFFWLILGFLRFQIWIKKPKEYGQLLLGFVLNLVLGGIFILSRPYEREKVKNFLKMKISSAWNYRINRKIKLEEKRVAEIESLKAKKRQLWKLQNPITLYYNSMNGIVSVLTAEDYATLKRHYQRRVDDGSLEKFSPIPLSVEYIIFADMDKISSDFHTYITGSRRDFDMLDTQGYILNRCTELFVPFVNETLESFENQQKIIGTRYSNNHTYRQESLKDFLLCIAARKITDFPESLQ